MYLQYLDMQWLQRIQAMLNIGNRLTYFLLLLFACAVVLIVGNTLRLTIEQHHEEIAIIKLIGATNRFIRRPYSYTGLIYGLCGGILACLIIYLALWALYRPIEHLSRLYHSHFLLKGLTLNYTILLLILSSLFGFFGAFFTANRQINAIEPQ